MRDFGNYEIIFCPVCGLDYQVIKKTSQVIIKSIQMHELNTQSTNSLIQTPINSKF
ncbi:MAG: hypothetical protein ABSA79_04690 [Candidatus Bathyarchaeia archaeon]